MAAVHFPRVDRAIHLQVDPEKLSRTSCGVLISNKPECLIVAAIGTVKYRDAFIIINPDNLRLSRQRLARLVKPYIKSAILDIIFLDINFPFNSVRIRGKNRDDLYFNILFSFIMNMLIKHYIYIL